MFTVPFELEINAKVYKRIVLGDVDDNQIYLHKENVTALPQVIYPIITIRMRNVYWLIVGCYQEKAKRLGAWFPCNVRRQRAQSGRFKHFECACTFWRP